MTAPLRSAEDISPGHPDRLADAVAEGLVDTALRLDPDALVGVEVAVHRHLVVVTGRIAATPDGAGLDHFTDEHLQALVEGAFAAAGYQGRWAIDLDVITDLDIGPLTDEERAIRRYSDDQNITIGHATPHPAHHRLPIETAAARHARAAITDLAAAHPDLLGPDAKVLIAITPTGSGAALTFANVSTQHTPGVGYEDLHRLVAPTLLDALAGLPGLDLPDRIDSTWLTVNGIGDFTCGGPLGDNGLSGKKLVVDHYGPHIPIGGGALCGKDVHKPDRSGPLRARQLAVRLTDATGETATVRLGWLPGGELPHLVQADLADGTTLDGHDLSRLIDVPDLSLAGTALDLELASVRWADALRRGYVGADWRWDHP